MRIALFATCLADALFPRSAQATVVLLERLGHDVRSRTGANRVTSFAPALYVMVGNSTNANGTTTSSTGADGTTLITPPC